MRWRQGDKEDKGIRRQGDKETRGTRGQGDKEIRRQGRMGRESIKSHEDLVVYQMAFDAAMEIFQFSKIFPQEERYSLTDQIRRSSCY